jgi:6-phosphogluconolactonase (cycloisomerase 2 family)
MLGKATCLPAALLGFLTVINCSCGGGSSAPVSTANPKPACRPALSSAHAYVLNDADNTVSIYTVNSCTGDLSPVTPPTVATGANDFGSEQMAVDPAGRFAYVANLISNASDEATISMYTIDASTGVLSPTTPATVPTGFFPQGIAIDPSGKFIYTANSDDNTVSMFTINQTTGVLTPTTPPAISTLANVSTGLYSSPEAVAVDPSGRFAYAVNEDDATVSMFTIDSSTGILIPTTPATVFTGPIPFDITVDPSGKFAYVPNNDSGGVDGFGISQYTIDSVTGVLTPNDPSAVGAGNGPTSVAVDPSSKFAYAVNRLDNTVSMFTIDPGTGNLTPNTPATIATGMQPWRIIVDPSGKFAYVTNQSSASLSIYRLNSNGTLTAAGTAPTGDNPVSVAITGTANSQ